MAPQFRPTLIITQIAELNYNLCLESSPPILKRVPDYLENCLFSLTVDAVPKWFMLVIKFNHWFYSYTPTNFDAWPEPPAVDRNKETALFLSKNNMEEF
jgi:hypothetical protein